MNSKKIVKVLYIYLVIYTPLEPIRLGIKRNKVMEREQPVCSIKSFSHIEQDLYNEVKNDSDFEEGLIITSLQLLSRKMIYSDNDINFDLNVSGITPTF